MIFFFKQKTAYERRISDWSSDVCSSDLGFDRHRAGRAEEQPHARRLAERKDRCLQFIADVVTIEGETESPGGVFDSLQVQQQMTDAFLRVEAHGLDEIERGAPGIGECAFGEAFAP